VGHKVHPNAFRLGPFRSWEANWFATEKDYTKLLHEDLDMRRLILSRLRNAGIARIETERSSNAQMTVTIHTAKPGIVIGKGGASVDQLREDLEKRFGNRVRISIQEIKQPELDAQLVAENIASQIERRISHRRAMKQSILRTMRAGAKGVRVAMAGRLRGGEMARRESDHEGKVPLHTLRADIKFGRATARTTYGVIGVKVWIYKDLMKSRTRGGQSQEDVFPQPQAEGRQPAPDAGGPAAPAVPSGTHAEAPGVAPGAPAVAGEAVRQQVSAERGGTSQRRRSPRSEGVGSSARPATPRPASGRSRPPERSVTPQEAVPHDESTETGTQPEPGSPAAEPGSPTKEEDRGAPT
jgi:small subunit ribosomal protein S3